MDSVLTSLNEIQTRAYELYTSSKPPSEWFKSEDGGSVFPNEGISLEDISFDDEVDGDVEDVIDMKLRVYVGLRILTRPSLIGDHETREREAVLVQFDFLDHRAFSVCLRRQVTMVLKRRRD
jgi:hypothetical protein